MKNGFYLFFRGVDYFLVTDKKNRTDTSPGQCTPARGSIFNQWGGYIVSIEVKSLFTGWHTVTDEQARRFVLHIMNNSTALKNPVGYIEQNRLRGCTVAQLLKGV